MLRALLCLHNLTAYSGVLCTLTLVLAALVFIFFKLWVEGPVVHGLPWAGTNGTAFPSRVWSTVRATYDLPNMLLEEYRKNRPYLISTFLNGPVLMLTRNHVRWYNSQLAKGSINFGLLQAEKLHMEYAAIDMDVDTTRYLNLLHRILTKKHLTGLSGVCEEVKRCIELKFGLKVNEWSDVLCFDAVEAVVAGSANRMVVGAPLCRDRQYLAAAKTCAKSMFPIAIIVKATPNFLRPLVGKLLKRLAQHHWEVLTDHVRPAARSVLDTMESTAAASAPPATLMEKFAHECLKTPGFSSFLTVDALQTLTGVVNVAALAATSLACSDVFLNVLSYKSSERLIEQLRKEAALLLSNEVTPESLDAMSLADSVCRETLRLENGDAFFVQGVVTEPIQTREGILLIRGDRVAMPMYGIHRDESIFPEDPESFDPYRFCLEKEKQVLAHEVSERYLAFSLGPHSCPGRWFAIAQMKIILSTLLLNYDIRALEKQPSGLRLGGYMIPPLRAKVSVKRRDTN